MSVIRPGKDAHRVLAMGDNRRGYGLRLEAGQTVQPQPFTLVGDGAGSIFKIFTSAAALDMGMGINALLDVPPTFQGKGPGRQQHSRLPAQDLVRQERRRLPQPDEHDRRTGALAEHRVRQADSTSRRRTRGRHGGAWAATPYAEPGTARAYVPKSNESLADYVKRENIGSFTLGPFEVNPLELSNVAATLASVAPWCPPSADREGLRPARRRDQPPDRQV